MRTRLFWIYALFIIFISTLFFQKYILNGVIKKIQVNSWSTLSQLKKSNIYKESASRTPKREISPWAKEKIDADEKLLKSESLKKIRIAVIDTGADVLHPNLVNNIWINSGESGLDSNGRIKANNGIDDDKNGYIDDLHGWNFVDNNNNISDQIGHGTHVAGIIGAHSSNYLEFSGVSKNVELMILKYFDKGPSEKNSVMNTVNAIDYAIQMKADIINYSSGGPQSNPLEERAIRRAMNNGILFVTAAGNEKSNTDRKGYFPANYELDNIIAVASVDLNFELLESSNFGKTHIDIAAPGKEILSLLPNNKIGIMSGTSQATAFVTGVAALVLGQGRFTGKPKSMKSHLVTTGKRRFKLSNKLNSWSVVNAYRAMTIYGGPIVSRVPTEAENFNDILLKSNSYREIKSIKKKA